MNLSRIFILRPIATSLLMVGGLIFSQALTLFTTPVIYLWFDRVSRRFKGHKAASGAGQEGTGARSKSPQEARP